jgi:hypothetical protein
MRRREAIVGGQVEALSAAQTAALRQIAALVGPNYFLVGDVAVALRCGHRISHDLDLFTASEEPENLIGKLDAAPGIRVISRSISTLHLEVAGIPTSLIRYAYPVLVAPEHFESLDVHVADVSDLIPMKLSAIANRGAARDFWDLDVLLAFKKISMHDALKLFEEKFKTHDVGHVVRALSYFGDANAAPLPRGLERPQWERICSSMRSHVLELVTLDRK